MCVCVCTVRLDTKQTRCLGDAASSWKECEPGVSERLCVPTAEQEEGTMKSRREKNKKLQRVSAVWTEVN